MIISFLIALSLNFDTFSVAVVEGSQTIKSTIKESLRVGFFFGMGQAFMALLGFFLGLGFRLIVMNIDHWIAFILLSSIGGKMIHESIIGKDSVKQTEIINIKSLLLLTIATSIDALVVGITFAFVSNSIVLNISMIGIITFIVSFVGYYAGHDLRRYCKSKVSIIGGLILVILGIKTLVQHLFFGG